MYDTIFIINIFIITIMSNYKENVLFVVEKIYHFFMYISCRTKPNDQDKIEYNKMYDLDDFNEEDN